MEKNRLKTDSGKPTVHTIVKSVLAMLLVFSLTMGITSCKNDDDDWTKDSLKGTEWTCVAANDEDIIHICFNSNTVESFLTKDGTLKGDVNSCDYKYLKGIYVKDGVVLSFDDLTFTFYPFSSNPGKSVFKSAKVSGSLMELYREAWSVTSSANTTRPTPDYTLRRVK